MCFALKAGAKVGALLTASNYFGLFFMLKNIKKTCPLIIRQIETIKKWLKTGGNTV
jgi:hypothetical protein